MKLVSAKGELILSIPEEIKEEVFRNFEFCILYIRMAVILVNQPDERMISTGIRSFEELVFQLYQIFAFTFQFFCSAIRRRNPCE